MKKIKIIFFLICLSFAHSLNALDDQLLSYQSIYEINLDTEREIKKTFGQPSISKASGELIIDWFFNCESWVSNQRMLVSFVNSAGVGTVSDISYSLEESTSNNKMKFLLQVKENNMIRQKVRGDVVKDDELKIEIYNPKKKEIAFPKDVMLPHEHLKLIIKSLDQKEGSIFSKKVYEGSLPENFFNISTFINQNSFKFTGIDLPKEVKNKFWDVRMAYYEEDSQTTSLELTAKINRQGIVSYFKYDYPDYSLVMKLKKLAVIKDSCTKQ